MTAYFILLATTAWASFLSNRNVLRNILFLAPTIFIVGFKYEVGFDWHVYVDQFQKFSEIAPGDFFPHFFAFVGFYQQEPFFILLSYVGARILGVYELFYCALFLFFMYSTARLGRLLGSNIAAAFFFIHLFLLFTLEFSTLRQMVSLSVLNLGICFSLEGRGIRGLALLLLSPFFQASSAVFVILFLLVRSKGSVVRVSLTFVLLAALAINAVGFHVLAPLISGVVPDFVASKLTYYAEVRRFDFHLLESLFAITLYFFLAFFLFYNWRSKNRAVKCLSTFSLLLIVIAIAAFAITTVRNRMLYEVITIGSLLIFSPHTRKPLFIRHVLIALGIVFFVASLLKPNSFMYVPYQNYLWFQVLGLDSDGRDRQDRLNAIIRNRDDS